uniref:Uncharacterized protein n=1 Tax=Vespula pensylvanica TaxID=30213 RepID=A0A834P1K7_VESPE|nr:hypothetical protein H0235_007472 [Vespula pensylvanica]
MPDVDCERKGDGTVGSAPREDQRQKGEGSARCSHKQLVASAKLPRLSYGNAKLETRLLGYTTYPAEWLGWAQVCVECERLPRESENGARSGVLDRWLKQRQFPSLYLLHLCIHPSCELFKSVFEPCGRELRVTSVETVVSSKITLNNNVPVLRCRTHDGRCKSLTTHGYLSKPTEKGYGKSSDW